MDDDQLYFNFENRFRGNRQDVINSFKVYDGSIAYCKSKFNTLNALDIGCGRGEWIEKLSFSGFDCLGIESNDSMVESCIENGFNIIHGDALNILKSLSDNKYSLISIFHVIEHLEKDYLDKILSQCNRLLTPGGLFLIETPSIDNIIVSSKTFYLDSSHINKINPDSLIYSLQNLGFNFAKYYYINSGPLFNADPLNLTRVLNGIAQDICIIASNINIQKDCESSEYLRIEETLVQGLSTLAAATDFDKSLRLTDQKILDNELALFKLEKRVMYLEEQNKSLKKIYASLNNSLPLKVLRLLKKIIAKINKFIFLAIKNILSKLIYFFPKLKVLSLLRCSKNNTSIISIMVYVLRKVGMERQAYMLPITFKKLSKYQDRSSKTNSILMNNYKLSLPANKIYKNLKSRLTK
tara:strand:- start:6460 stop:7689 length:1230 start_codon:yes stop_codon:yes gene_type:complete